MDKKIIDIDSRQTGKSALDSNIDAAIFTADIVKSTLGPMGQDKMLIDEFGEILITNDGVKILSEMKVEHPAAKLLVEVAKTQEDLVGDGTTTAVIYTGELLRLAKKLISKNIHPTNIITGFKLAQNRAIEILNESSKSIDINSKDILREIVEVAMTGKVADNNKKYLSELLFNVVENIVENDDNLDLDNLKILKIVGSEIVDSKIVDGIVLDKDLAHMNMKTNISDSKILLIDFPLEVRELDSASNLQISTPEDYQRFLDSENMYLKKIARKIIEIGCNFVVCQKGIDDNVAYYLAKEGISAIRRCRRSDIKRLSKAINKKVVNNFDDVIEENLGFAKSVEIKKLGGFNYTFVSGIKNPKSMSLILKASTNHILDEIKRAVDDSFGDLKSVLKSKKIVAGGGAIEVELYRKLIEYSKTLVGKNQIIVENFAKMFLSIPKILCNNCGLDEIDILSELIKNHENKLKFSGIDGHIGVVENTFDSKIIEPINIKNQAIKTACETATMILRIDDIIAAKKLNTQDFKEIKNSF